MAGREVSLRGRQWFSCSLREEGHLLGIGHRPRWLQMRKWEWFKEGQTGELMVLKAQQVGVHLQLTNQRVLWIITDYYYFLFILFMKVRVIFPWGPSMRQAWGLPGRSYGRCRLCTAASSSGLLYEISLF